MKWFVETMPRAVYCKFKKLYKISIAKKLFKAAFVRVEPMLFLNVSFFKMITNKSTNQNQLITKFYCKTEAINSIFNGFVMDVHLMKQGIG